MEWKRVAKIVYLLILVPLGAWLIGTRWESVSALSAGISLPLVVATVLFAFAPPAMSSYFWLVALRSGGSDVTYRMVATTTAQSLLSRYVPGGVWYAASRVALLASHGVQTARSTFVAATELAMTILVALAIGAPVVAIGSGRTALGTALLAVSVGGLAFGQPLVGWLSAKLDKDGASSAIDSSTYLRLIAISAGFWITLTGVFVFYMRSVSVGDDINAALLGGAYPLAWVVGWLAPFAPQGIGVFEATISAILASNELADLAVVIVGFRAILLVRDLAATGIAALIRGPSLSAK